jgi:DNA-binding transcriptional LysR family regulator
MEAPAEQPCLELLVGGQAGHIDEWIHSVAKGNCHYAAKEGIRLKQNYDAETLSGGMSLVASTGGFTLLPLYVRNALIPSVVARPLRGEVPTIGLMMGYNKSNTSPLLKRFLLRADVLVKRVVQGMAPAR